MTRKITSDYMISGGKIYRKPLIEIDAEGTVLSLQTNLDETPEDAEYYSGLIIPGMVNAHCHLEYSYVKGKIERGGGLPHFISSIISIKINDKTPDEQKTEAAREIDQQMILEGVVAVGDHNNNDYVYEIKEQSPIHYHSFVELYDVDGQDADTSFHQGLERVKAHQDKGLEATIAPHATYTMEDRLLGLCGGVLTSEQGEKAQGVCSVHFKESVAMAGEQESDRIFAALTPERENTLLVHSVYATGSDIDRAKALLGDRMSVVVCPLSNHYIENSMADVKMLMDKGVRVAIGTDSLSSNDDISMVGEMHKLSQCYPELPLETIVDWATRNGAVALGIDDWAGTIEVGKYPALVHIEDFDSETMRLSENSRGVRIG